jgi:predicted RNA methylase
MEDLFPKREGLDFTKLKTTEEGSYSITRRRDAERIFNVLRHNMPPLKDMTITDTTACNGGDTINFSLHSNHVHSIEVNHENFEVLSNNISAYGLTNITLYEGDSTQIFNWYTDVLYIDPPWGGKEYRSKKNLDLFLSNKRLDVWLEEILRRRNRPAFIVLKLPFNYKFDRFNVLSNVDHIRPFQIRTYVLVIIYVHRPTA